MWDISQRPPSDRAKESGKSKKEDAFQVIDNKFVRHAIELTKWRWFLWDRVTSRKSPHRSRSCPPVRLSVRALRPLYTSSRLFSYSFSSLSRFAARESSLNHCPLISRRQRHRQLAAQEKESSSRLSSRFPLNFDSAFFCRLLELRETSWRREERSGGLKEWSLRA